MKHTTNSQKHSDDFIYTKAGTCITTRWRKMGWKPASECHEIQAKWAKYQTLANRTLNDIPTNSVEHV